MMLSSKSRHVTFSLPKKNEVFVLRKKTPAVIAKALKSKIYIYFIIVI